MTADTIRVMYVVGSMGDARAGTEKNLLTIIENLDRKRFTPFLVSLQDCEYIRKGDFFCNTTCLNVYRMFSPEMRRGRAELVKVMRRERIDIVQTFFTEAHIVGGAAARLADAKAIVSSRRNLGYSYSFKEKLFLKIANRYPTRWLANCSAVADKISALERIDRFKFDVIYNGVAVRESSDLETPKEPIRTVDLVMVANLRPIKSVETLIEATALVTKTHPEIRVMIIGAGDLRDDLSNLARRLGVSAGIKFAGSHNDVIPLLLSAKIGVLTSLSEGCSNAILEYMNASLPVIASAVGGNPELVSDGETGYLFPPKDARALAEKIVFLLENPDDATRFGQSGRARVKQEFSLNKMIEAHENYYERLTASK